MNDYHAKYQKYKVKYLQAKNNNQNDSYLTGGNDTYEFVANGASGCVFKKKDSQTVVKIAVLVNGTKVNTQSENEYEVNAYIKFEAKKDTSLYDHLVILNTYAYYKNNNFVTGSNNYANDISFFINECAGNISETIPTFSTTDNIYLLLDFPYGGISLENYINNFINNHPDANMAETLKNIINGSLASLRKLHELHILHGDLNNGNILVDTSDNSINNIKYRLIDFSTSITDINSITINEFKRINHTVPNVSPEYILLGMEDNMVEFAHGRSHFFSFNDVKQQIMKLKNMNKSEISAYYNNKENLYKLDLYNIGCTFDDLLYKKKIDKIKNQLIDVPIFKIPELEENGSIYNFIKSITDVDYAKRPLVYKIN